MCDSLYVKANGEFPCWSGVGESLALQVLDERDLNSSDCPSLFYSPELIGVRKAFLENRTPHGDLCSKCSVRGEGVVTSLHPQKMRILHVEPAYLCQLSCPECILPKTRLKLKKPPYYMKLSYYEALLLRLLEEGVRDIHIVQFEGRGEPLLNQRIGDMVRLTRELFPDSYIQITSHGNFPFRPWMVDSGLNLLTLSVDGAFPESYRRYRVGGELESALALMRDLRDHKRSADSPLEVRWKYILFEWNDGDDELREAHRLADELDVELSFTLTHTPGKSQRFPDMETLQAKLVELSLRAKTSTTPQLKARRDLEDLKREHARGLLVSAFEKLDRGDREAARAALAESLAFDPDLGAPGAGDEELMSRHTERIIAEADANAIYHWAEATFVLRDWANATRLYRSFLEISSNGANRATAESHLIVLWIGKKLGYCLPLGSLYEYAAWPANFLLNLGLGTLLRRNIRWIFRWAYG